MSNGTSWQYFDLLICVSRDEGEVCAELCAGGLESDKLRKMFDARGPSSFEENLSLFFLIDS